MNNCPCCAAQLLPHIRSKRIYWYCSRCRQDMPVQDAAKTYYREQLPLVNPLNELLSKRILTTAE